MKQSYFSTEPQYQPYVYKTLTGRYAHWPAQSATAKRTFVLIYGQHATLERIQPIAESLAAYGDVYAVDTPGFGGMDASYKIREYPSLDFLGGHLQHFINTRIPADRLLTFLGISFGFQVVANMLANDQIISKRTEQVISFVGFPTYKDFSMPLSYKGFYLLAAFGRNRVGSSILRGVMRPAFMKSVYFLARPVNVKYKSLDKKEAATYVGEQTWLWMVNDHRTHAATAWDFWFKNDLTNLKIDADAVHIGVPRDHLLKNTQIAQELKGMFRNLEAMELNLANHAPLDVDTADKVSALLPATLKALLESSRNKVAITK